MRAMTRIAAVIFLCVSAYANTNEPCKLVHGRAHHATDGGPRIWATATHHEYEPADTASAERLDKWLAAGISKSAWKTAVPYSTVDMYADFTICPAEPLRKGAVQRAKIKSASHRR
jgi:hypothetical protein